MATLESYVNSVRNLTSSKNWVDLARIVSSHQSLLIQSANSLDTVLGTFELPMHTLGYLGVLSAKSCSSLLLDHTAFDTFLIQLRDFLLRCEAIHLQQCVPIYIALIHKVEALVIEKGQGARGIEILCIAIEKFQTSSNQLTSIHADLMHLCLVSKLFHPALKYLYIDYVDIHKEVGIFDSLQFLLFCYYGGILLSALKRLDRAVYWFEMALQVPATAVSAIAIEAYKKYIVCLLLHAGCLTRASQLPRNVPRHINQFVKPHCQPYNEIADAFAKGSPINLESVLSKHSLVLQRDQNTGLAKQLIPALYRKNVVKLTKTFMTLSLADVANRAQLPGGVREAEKLLCEMIASGEIGARISQRDGMVEFLDPPRVASFAQPSPAFLEELDARIGELQTTETTVRRLERELALSPVYVQQAMSGAASAHGSTAKAYDADLDFDMDPAIEMGYGSRGGRPN